MTKHSMRSTLEMKELLRLSGGSMEQGKSSGYQYQICVEGHIGADWIDWPRTVEICHTFDSKRLHPVTQVSVRLPDQPALYGLLERLRDLNLKLVSLQREEMESLCQK